MHLYTKSQRVGSRVIGNDPSFPSIAATIKYQDEKRTTSASARDLDGERFDAISHCFDQELCVGSSNSQSIFDGRYGKVASKVLANLNAQSEPKVGASSVRTTLPRVIVLCCVNQTT